VAVIIRGDRGSASSPPHGTGTPTKASRRLCDRGGNLTAWSGMRKRRGMSWEGDRARLPNPSRKVGTSADCRIPGLIFGRRWASLDMAVDGHLVDSNLLGDLCNTHAC